MGFIYNDGVGLAHRRLSIIDLSPRGHQPIGTRRARICIAFNGEIYNYRELRADSMRAVSASGATSDTEVHPEPLLRDGTEMLIG